MKVREVVRRLLRYPGDVRAVAEVMQISRSRAKQLLEELIGAGYVEPVRDAGRRKLWSTTLAGSALAGASAALPLRRATAERRLAEFLERVRQVNGNEYWLYRVRKIVLFGSMLTERSTVNDVDLAVHLVPKIEDTDTMWQLRRARVDEALKQGRRFDNLSDEMGWPRHQIFQFLRARTRTLNLADYPSQEFLFAQAPHRVIFEES